MKYSWHLQMYKIQTKLRGPNKVGGGMKELPFAINGNAKAQTDTRTPTHTKNTRKTCPVTGRGGKQRKATLCSYRKSFWQTLCDSRCIFPINFHLQHWQFASICQLHFDMLQFSSLREYMYIYKRLFCPPLACVSNLWRHLSIKLLRKLN